MLFYFKKEDKRPSFDRQIPSLLTPAASKADPQTLQNGKNNKNSIDDIFAGLKPKTGPSRTPEAPLVVVESVQWIAPVPDSRMEIESPAEFPPVFSRTVSTPTAAVRVGNLRFHKPTKFRTLAKRWLRNLPLASPRSLPSQNGLHLEVDPLLTVKSLREIRQVSSSAKRT